MSRAVITDLSYTTGSLTESLEDAQALKLLLSTTQALSDSGFAQHHRALPTEDTLGFAISAVEKIGQRHDLQSIDAIVFSTCIPHNANCGSEESYRQSRDVKFMMDYTASRLQAHFGLQSFVVGLGQQACTGLLGGMRIARALIKSEDEVNKVLCLTSDRFPEGALYEQSFNLISDGAAVALIERDAPGYEIVGCHQLTNGAMSQANDDETVGHFFAYIHRCVQELLQRTQLKPSDIKWIVPQNTNRKAWMILSKLLKVPFENVALKTLGSVGHMISGDNIVNLMALEETGKVQVGDHLLMLMAGFGLNWQAVVLKKTA